MTTISASRVGALLGESKFMTRLALHYQLTGEAPPREDDDLLEEGREFEPVIAKVFARHYGLTLIAANGVELRHGDLSGHPDFFVVDADGNLAVLEIKNTLFSDQTSEFSGWGDPWSDQVPPDYLFQAMTYAWLLQRTDLRELDEKVMAPLYAASPACKRPLMPQRAASYALIGARLFSGTRPYRIAVDDALMSKVELEASAFLDRVARKEPPEPLEPSEFRQRWLPVADSWAEAGLEQVELAKQLRALRQQKKWIEQQEEEVAALLLGYLGDRAELRYSGEKLITANVDRKFDAAAFTLAHPEIAAHCMKLDASKVAKEYRVYHEQFMVKPESAADAKRVLRVNDRALAAIETTNGGGTR